MLIQHFPVEPVLLQALDFLRYHHFRQQFISMCIRCSIINIESFLICLSGIEAPDIMQTKKPLLICQIRIPYHLFNISCNDFPLMAFCMLIFPNARFLIRTFAIPLVRALPPPHRPFRKAQLFRDVDQLPTGQVHGLRLAYPLVRRSGHDHHPSFVGFATRTILSLKSTSFRCFPKKGAFCVEY